ncbi:hypothetical protein ABPG72_017316 [Tetrahymena utriculariae]
MHSKQISFKSEKFSELHKKSSDHKMAESLPKTREENRKIVDEDITLIGIQILKKGLCFNENWYDEYTHIGQYDNNSRLLKAHAHYITHQINEQFFKSEKQFSFKDILLLQQRLLFALQLRNIGDIIYLTLRKKIPKKSILKHKFYNNQLSDTSEILDEVIKTCKESGIVDNLKDNNLVIYQKLEKNILRMREQDQTIHQQLDSTQQSYETNQEQQKNE